MSLVSRAYRPDAGNTIQPQTDDGLSVFGVYSHVAADNERDKQRPEVQKMMTREMIVLERGNAKFMMRAVAIFIDGDRVLLHRTEQDDFWALPGGRVEMMEPSRESLIREMQEEMGLDVHVERLVWVVENFFPFEGKVFHELGLYFLASLPTGSPLYDTSEPFFGDEGGIKLIFQWFPIADLEHVSLNPAFLRTRLRSLPERIEFITHFDEGFSA